MLALLGAVLALLLSEALARLHGDRLCLEAPGVVYERDARFGWRHVPGMSGWAGTCRTARVPMAPIDADTHGLLGPERPREKPAHTARILLLGGNGPEGLGVRPPLTVAPLLEALADRRRGAALEVLNGAAGGFVLDNDLLFFREEGRRYAPDIVLVVLDPTSELIALSPRLIYLSGQTAPAKPSFRLANDRLELTPLAPEPPDETAPVPATGLARFQLFRLWKDLPSRVGPRLGFTQGEAPPDGTTVDLPAEQARARALGRALLSELRAETEAAGATLVAAIGPIHQAVWDPEGGQDDQVLRDLTRDLHIPTVDLGAAFRAGESSGAQVYLPGSGRWGPDGHFVASQAIWQFLTSHRLLPADVVSVTTINGGQHLDVRDLGRVIPQFLWRERDSTAARFVMLGLLAVAIVWMGTVLPPAAHEWLGVVLGVALIAALGARWLAPVTAAVALVWYAAVELLPARVSRAGLPVLAAAVVLVPLVRTLPLVAGVGRDQRLFFALVSGVALLRLIAYAVDRRSHGAPRRSLREFLAATFFFPTLLFGPVEPPETHLAARPPGGLAPTSFAGLAGHLGASAIGVGRVLLGSAKVTLATAAVALVSPDVWMTAGQAVGRGRLWLWVAELPLFLYLLGSGSSDVAIGLGAMVGVPVPANFRAPWAARDAADFWRRWLATIRNWLRRYVFEPVRARGGSEVAVAGAFIVAMLWLLWMAALVFGGMSRGRPGVPTGFLAWCAMNTAAVLAVRRWPNRRTALLSLLVVHLSWMPLSLPPGLGLGTCASILLRLVGLR